MTTEPLNAQSDDKLAKERRPKSFWVVFSIWTLGMVAVITAQFLTLADPPPVRAVLWTLWAFGTAAMVGSIVATAILQRISPEFKERGAKVLTMCIPIWIPLLTLTYILRHN